MSHLTHPFSRSPRTNTAWFCAGPASSYPNVDDSTRVGDQHACQGKYLPGCRVFHVPRTAGAKATEVAIDEWKETGAGSTREQVMVFRYKGGFVAVDHECPHSSYPLSNGTPFDIEDFGVVLSLGITCPKHGWSFDLHTGRADRGSYRLNVWDVEQRASPTAQGELEVWIRRKQKIG
ncbi:hypothetical protein IAQ61_011191 [Plenodomus lingam]|uniref:uncharacterized protein n=1 Tax=Leptosphaeria maculans TaxID=5022 RepID=UPI00332857CF|nr:hypothetical protein IAQ61_011191 [Plenodomus lingam]